MHWHGLRLENRCDGTHETQAPTPVGGSFSARVIWATGYRVDHSFVAVPVFDSAGRPVHERGITSSEGLYFLGLKIAYAVYPDFTALDLVGPLPAAGAAGGEPRRSA